MRKSHFTFFVSLLFVAFSLQLVIVFASSKLLFPDVDKNSYYYDSVSFMNELQIIRGYDNGLFGPNDSLNRAQAATIFKRYHDSVVVPLQEALNSLIACNATCEIDEVSFEPLELESSTLDKGETFSFSEYPDEQNIDYDAFPSLSDSDFNGQTLYVAPGSAIPDINTALTLANNGDKIIVRAGTYPGEINVNKSVYLSAYEGEKVIISGNDRAGLRINGDNILIDGFDIIGFTGVGIALYDHSNVYIRNVSVSMGTNSFLDGIVAYSSSDALFVENVEIDGADLSLSCNEGPCTNWKISNVKIEGRNASGGSGSDCFAIENGSNLFLKDIEVTACTADGIDIKGSNVLIMNAFVHNIGRNGIKLWNGGDIVNTLVYDTGADASLAFSNAGLYRLMNSTIAYHSRDGRAYMLSVGYDNPSAEIDVKIINSILHHNSAQVMNPFMNGSSRTLMVENSIFNDVELSDEVKAEIEKSSTNKIDTDPQFVDSSTEGDFHLLASSPALNAGQETEFVFDLQNISRPNGAAYDIGAYEN